LKENFDEKSKIFKLVLDLAEENVY